jgi:hypothetical protein
MGPWEGPWARWHTSVVGKRSVGRDKDTNDVGLNYEQASLHVTVSVVC